MAEKLDFSLPKRKLGRCGRLDAPCWVSLWPHNLVLVLKVESRGAARPFNSAGQEPGGQTTQRISINRQRPGALPGEPTWPGPSAGFTSIGAAGEGPASMVIRSSNYRSEAGDVRELRPSSTLTSRNVLRNWASSRCGIIDGPYEPELAIRRRQVVGNRGGQGHGGSIGCSGSRVSRASWLR
jgi:hypothetical protein